MKNPLTALLPLAALLACAAISLAQAETIQHGSVRIALEGSITPKRLPREGSAAVRVKVGTKISAVKASRLPQLTRISIAINRHGRLDPTGLPVCEIGDIQPSTTAKALEACGPSLVGEGHLAATVGLSSRITFPSQGKLVAFNGIYKGRPAILAHVYGTDPLPTSFTLPFVISQGRGTFATILTARLPAAEGNFLTALDLDLGRSFTYRGKRRSYASAGCPAPKGFPGATFPFARVSYAFAKGPQLSSTLTRSCSARG